jgi:exportin-1
LPLLQLIYKKLVPPLLEPVLDDYKRNVADARDSEVLGLFAAIISKLGTTMVPHVTRIFESVFEVTLDMITKNFEGLYLHSVFFFFSRTMTHFSSFSHRLS